MKSALNCLALVAFAMVASAQPSAAQGYSGPWCAVFNLGIGSVQEKCDFASFEMCRREALHYGSSSFCRQSNWYAPYWGVGEARAHAHVRKHHRRAH
jgi:hypothetical protein